MTLLLHISLALLTALFVTLSALPITSKPLARSPDHLLWDGLALDASGDRLKQLPHDQKSRKITPKSIFITPNVSNPAALCPPGHKTDVKGGCIQIVTIDHEEILATRIQGLLAAGGGVGLAEENDEEDFYDYGLGGEDTEPLQFQIPLGIDFGFNDEDGDSVVLDSAVSAAQIAEQSTVSPRVVTTTGSSEVWSSTVGFSSTTKETESTEISTEETTTVPPTTTTETTLMPEELTTELFDEEDFTSDDQEDALEDMKSDYLLFAGTRRDAVRTTTERPDETLSTTTLTDSTLSTIDWAETSTLPPTTEITDLSSSSSSYSSTIEQETTLPTLAVAEETKKPPQLERPHHKPFEFFQYKNPPPPHPSKQTFETKTTKPLKSFAWLPVGWEVDQSGQKPLLLRFWSQMPLIKDTSVARFQRTRENSKSPSEKLYKEVSAQTVFQNANRNWKHTIT